MMIRVDPLSVSVECPEHEVILLFAIDYCVCAEKCPVSLQMLGIIFLTVFSQVFLITTFKTSLLVL